MPGFLMYHSVVLTFGILPGKKREKSFYILERKMTTNKEKNLLMCIKDWENTSRDEWRTAFEKVNETPFKEIVESLKNEHRDLKAFQYLFDVRFQNVFLDYLRSSIPKEARTAVDYLTFLIDIDKKEVEKFIWSLKKLNDFYYRFKSFHIEGKPGKKQKKLILLSHSPRRMDIMKKMLIDQEDVVLEAAGNKTVTEYFSEVSGPYAGVMALALQKLLGVIFEELDSGLAIAADTVVMVDGTIIGKSQTRSEAENRLMKFSNKMVRCISGMATADLDRGKISLDFNLGDILFRDFNERLTGGERDYCIKKDCESVRDLILNYVEEGKSESKAGSFGIQDPEIITAAEFIVGDWLSIIGLPHPELRSRLNDYIQPSREIRPLAPTIFWPIINDLDPSEKILPANKYDMLIHLEMDKEYRSLADEHRVENPLIYHKFAEKTRGLNIYRQSSKIMDYYSLPGFSENLDTLFDSLEKSANDFFTCSKPGLKTLDAREYKKILEVDQYFELKEKHLNQTEEWFEKREKARSDYEQLREYSAEINQNQLKKMKIQELEMARGNHLIEAIKILQKNNTSNTERLEREELLADQLTRVAASNLNDELNKWRNLRNPRDLSRIDHRWQFIRFLEENHREIENIYILLDNVDRECLEAIALGIMFLAFLEGKETKKEGGGEDKKRRLQLVAVEKPHFRTMATVEDVKYILYQFLKKEEIGKFEDKIDPPIPYGEKLISDLFDTPGEKHQRIVVSVGSKSLKQLQKEIDKRKEKEEKDKRPETLRDKKITDLDLLSIFVFKSDVFTESFITQLSCNFEEVEFPGDCVGSYYYLFCKERREKQWEPRTKPRTTSQVFEIDKYIQGQGKGEIPGEFFEEFGIDGNQAGQFWKLVAFERFYERLFQHEKDTPGNRENFLLAAFSMLQWQNGGKEVIDYFQCRSPFWDEPRNLFARDLLIFMIEQNVDKIGPMQDLFKSFFQFQEKNIFADNGNYILATQKDDPREKILLEKRPGIEYETKERRTKKEGNLYNIGSEAARSIASSLRSDWCSYKILTYNGAWERVPGITSFRTAFSQCYLTFSGEDFALRHQFILCPLDIVDAKRMIEECSKKIFKATSSEVTIQYKNKELEVQIYSSTAYAKLHSLNNFMNNESLKTFKEALINQPGTDGDEKIKELENSINARITYRSLIDIYLDVYEPVVTKRTGGIMIQNDLFKGVVEQFVGPKDTIIGIPDPKNAGVNEETILLNAVVENLVKRRFYNVHCFIENLYAFYKTKSRYTGHGNNDYREKATHIENFLLSTYSRLPDLNWNTLFISTADWIDYHLKVDILLHHLGDINKPHPYVEYRNNLPKVPVDAGDTLPSSLDNFDLTLLANKSEYIKIKKEENLPFADHPEELSVENLKHKNAFLTFIKEGKCGRIAILAGNYGDELDYMLKEVQEWKSKGSNPDVTFICHPIPFLLWDVVKEDIEKMENPPEVLLNLDNCCELNLNQYHLVLLKGLSRFDTIIVQGEFWYRLFWYDEFPPTPRKNTPPLTGKNILIRKAIKNSEESIFELDESGRPREEKDCLVHFYRAKGIVEQTVTGDKANEEKELPEPRAEFPSYYENYIKDYFENKLKAPRSSNSHFDQIESGIEKYCRILGRTQGIDSTYDCPFYAFVRENLRVCPLFNRQNENSCPRGLHPADRLDWDYNDNPYAVAIARRLLEYPGDEKKDIVLKMLEYCQNRTLSIIENAMILNSGQNTADGYYESKINQTGEIDYPARVNDELLKRLKKVPEKEKINIVKIKRLKEGGELKDRISIISELWPLHLTILLTALAEHPPTPDQNVLYILTLSGDRKIENSDYKFITSCFIQFFPVDTKNPEGTETCRQCLPNISSCHGIRVEKNGILIGNPFNEFVYDDFVRVLYKRYRGEEVAPGLTLSKIAQEILSAILTGNDKLLKKYDYGNSRIIVDKMKFYDLRPEDARGKLLLKKQQVSYRLWEASSTLESLSKNYQLSNMGPQNEDQWRFNLISLDIQTLEYLKIDKYFCTECGWLNHPIPLMPENVIIKDWNGFLSDRAAVHLKFDANNEKEKKAALFMNGFRTFEDYLSRNSEKLHDLFDYDGEREKLFDEAFEAISRIAVEDLWCDVVKFSDLRKQEVANILDERKLFLVYLKNISLYNKNIEVAFFLNNAGPETMFALWLSYLLLNAGISVSLYAPTFPIIQKDVTIDDLIALIPYFDGILVNKLGAKLRRSRRLLGGFLRKSFREKERVLEIKAFNSGFGEQHEVRKDLIREAGNYNAVILIGEMWYGYLCGLGKVLDHPVFYYYDRDNSFKVDSLEKMGWKVQVGNAIKNLEKEVETITEKECLADTHIFAILTHKNPRQELDVWEEKSGKFAHDVFDTGGNVFQFFPAANYRGDSYNGWRKVLKVYKIEGIAELSYNQKRFIEKAFMACGFYFDLKDFKYEVKPVEKENHSYLYKTPNKRILLSIKKIGENYLMFIEFMVNFGNLKKFTEKEAQGIRSNYYIRKEEWPLLSSKIPSLIAKHLQRSFRGQVEINDLSRKRHDPQTDYPTENFIFLSSAGSKSDITFDLKVETRDSNAGKQLVKITLNFKFRITFNEGEVYLLQLRKYLRNFPGNKGKEGKGSKEERSYISLYVPAFGLREENRLISYVPNVSLAENKLEVLRVLKLEANQAGVEVCPIFPQDEKIFWKIDDRPGITIDQIYSVLPAPIDIDTPVAERMVVRKLLAEIQDSPDNSKKFISYSEMVRIGNLFERNDDPGWWEDYDYMTGLPRMNIHSEEHVLIQLVAPHDTVSANIFKDAAGNSNWVKISRYFAAAAELAILNGAVGVDLNFGSPAVANQGGGARFSDNEDARKEAITICRDIGQRLVHGFKKKETLPGFPFLTAKIRLCPIKENSKEPDWNTTKQFINDLFQHVDWVVLHLRTKEQGYSGYCEDFFKNNKVNALKIDDKKGKKLFYNGDLFSMEEVEKFKKFKVFNEIFDGIMIARGMQGNPFLVVDAIKRLEYGHKIRTEWGIERIKRALELHLEYKEANLGYSFLPERFKASLNKYAKLIIDRLNDKERDSLHKMLKPMELIDRELYETDLKRIIKPKFFITDRCRKCRSCMVKTRCVGITEERGLIRIDEKKCKSCGRCYKVCPYNAIELVS
jgi:septum formation protein